jgi:hypothetical protein
LNFPTFNTSSPEGTGGRYMHFMFKTTTEKVEFLINGNWDAKFNPRTQVSNNGWFDYVLDLGSGARDVNQITVLFDMRTGENCDTSAPINESYNNHNKYMWIDQIAVNNEPAKRTGTSCPSSLSDIHENSRLNIYVNENKQIVVSSSLSGNSNLNRISVYSISGKKIIEQDVNNAVTVINTNLTIGIYLVKLQQGNALKTNKIVVF